MKVVILCGGQGTRIRDVAENIPKPMIPIGGRPILWHIMKSYAQAGHDEFVLCLGHLGDVIKSFFLDYHARTSDFTITLSQTPEIEFHGADEAGWKVTLVDTGGAVQTGARVRRIRDHVAGGDDFMLTYGDGVADVDFDALVAAHRSQDRTLTVTGVRPPGRFGELEHDGEGRVVEFNEKPQTTGGRISGGFFVCKQALFDVLDEGDDLVFEQQPMRRLVADGEIAMYPHDGFWQCMDTPRDHRLLTDLWHSGRAPWKTW